MFFCFSTKNLSIQALILFLAFRSFQLLAAYPTNASQQLHHSIRDYQLSDSYDLTSFPGYGDIGLVLKDPDSLEFKICSTSEMSKASALFCFPTSSQQQSKGILGGCGAVMCAYNLQPAENDKLNLFIPTKCFNGKLDQTAVYAHNFNNEDKPQPANGCPMKVDAGNLFKLKILSMTESVTVKALNAKKYVPPTTPSPQLDHAADKVSQSVAEGGISCALLAVLIGGGVLIVVLVIITVIAAVIYFKRMNAKKHHPVTVIQVNGPKPAAEVQTEMPSQVQPKSKAPKDVEKPKVEASKPKEKIAKAPKNAEANPPKNSPLKTAIEEIKRKTDPTLESTSLMVLLHLSSMKMIMMKMPWCHLLNLLLFVVLLQLFRLDDQSGTDEEDTSTIWQAV